MYIYTGRFIVLIKKKLFNRHLDFSDRSQLERFDDKKKKKKEKRRKGREFRELLRRSRARVTSPALSHTDYRAANVSKIMGEKKKKCKEISFVCIMIFLIIEICKMFFYPNKCIHV